MLKQDKINKLIPIAMQAIRDNKIANSDDVVNKEYEGYIASFGANLVQSGLIPTLIFYKNDSGKAQKSSYWLKAIMQMLNEDLKDKDLIEYILDKCKNNDAEKFKTQDLNYKKLMVFEDKISHIVIALKMAVRTFKIKERE